MADEAVKVAVRKTAPTSTKKFIAGFSRGRLGKTSYIDALAQIALAADRPFLLADGDLRNPTLSRLYPPGQDAQGNPTGARVPGEPTPGGFATLVTAILDEVATSKANVSAILDLGGGQDETLAEYIRDLNIVRFCERKGILPVAVYMIGPDQDDFDHALAVRDSGIFKTPNVLLVHNEALVKRRQTPREVFGPVMKRPEYTDWVREGAKPVFMRNLGVMEKLRRAGLSLTEAAQGNKAPDGTVCGPAERWQIEEWLEDLVAEHREADALGMMP
jgi:hypothetical protein